MFPDEKDPSVVFDDYLNSIEDLAPEFRNVIEELNQKQRQIQVLQDEMDKENRAWDTFERIYGRMTPYPDEDAVLSRVARINERILELSDEKIRIADRALHLLDRHIKRLDENLAMFSLPTPQPESTPGTPEVSVMDPDPMISLLSMTSTPPPNFPARPLTPLPPSLLTITASTTAAASANSSVPASPMPSGPESPSPMYGGMVGAFLPPPPATVPKKAIRKEALPPVPGGGTIRKRKHKQGDKINKRSASSLRYSFTPEPENVDAGLHYQLSNASNNAILRMEKAVSQNPQTPTPPHQLQSSVMVIDATTTEYVDNHVIETVEDEQLYCLCQRISQGEMIACDNEDCHIEWFHLGCVGLATAPEGKWFCPECRKGMKSTSGRRKTNLSNT
ncbi:hypothetical protein SeLEV6574_g01915 [Synchytrium endobioticum]|nr:hypothetical protein SeLEV6574_g01915 [Synchytrium endobioticum]